MFTLRTGAVMGGLVMRATLSLFVVLFFIAGCGGGASDSGTMVEEIPEEVEEEEVEEEEVEEEEAEEEEAEEEEAEEEEVEEEEVEEEEVEMGYSENNCYYHTEQEIVDFLLDNRRGHPVHRWITSPVVYIDYGASEQNVRLVREVLEEINAVIPDEYDIEFGGIREMELIVFTQWDYGEIAMFFVPSFMDDRFGRLGSMRSHWLGHASFGYHPDAYPTYGEIFILEEMPERHNCETVIRQVIAHELVHTLGFWHPVNPSQWRETSIMTIPYRGSCGNEVIDGVLGTMDKDAIRAVYSLENNTRPEEFMADESHCE